MKRWEYWSWRSDAVSDAVLNIHGANGWELITCQDCGKDFWIVMKREVPTDTAPGGAE